MSEFFALIFPKVLISQLKQLTFFFLNNFCLEIYKTTLNFKIFNLKLYN